MKAMDSEKEARIWQRVRGTPPAAPPEENLRSLIANEWTAAAVYLRLARQLPAEAAVLQRLSREEQTHAACLKGIYALSTGLQPVIQTPPPPDDPAPIALRKRYGAQLRALRAYESRAQDPEYGAAFARLAEHEREHCRTLLELIGGLGEPGRRSAAPSRGGK